MTHKQPLKPSLLAIAVSAGMLATYSHSNVAAEVVPQDDVEKTQSVNKNNEEKSAEEKKAEAGAEVVEVVGIRRNLKKALDIKENATSVVDLTLSDDIGKFPDANIADALKRIPGVTTTRSSGGESRNVIVRGLNGGYVTTTINGRRMASENTGRDFNYDVLSSELVRSLAVYKSAEARLSEGGVGGIVDIETRRPLNLEGFTSAVAIKGSYDTRVNDVLPQVSTIWGTKNDDGTLGILFTGVYSKQTVRVDTYSGSGFYDAGDAAIAQDPNNEQGIGLYDIQILPYDVNHDGVVDRDCDTTAGWSSNYDTCFATEGVPSTMPTYSYLTNMQDERERVGASFALQWRPNDKLDINLDTILTSYHNNAQTYTLGFVAVDEFWANSYPHITDVHLNEQGYADRYTMGGDGHKAMLELINQSRPRKTDTYMIGLNAVWYAKDNVQLSADLSLSRATEKNDGQNNFVVSRGFVDYITFDRSDGGAVPDIRMPAITSDTPFGAHYTSISGTGVVSASNELKLDGVWTPDSDYVQSLRFGVNYSELSKERKVYDLRNCCLFSAGGAGILNLHRDDPAFAALLASHTMNTEIGPLVQIPASAYTNANFGNFLAGEAANVPSSWPSFDVNELLNFYRTIDSAAVDLYMTPEYRKADSYQIEENVLATYLQARHEGQIGSHPYWVDVGLRYAKTNVTSEGWGRDWANIQFDVNGNPTSAWRNNVVPVSYESSYGNWLPSLNAKLELAADLTLRFSAAKVMARPDISQMGTWASANFSQPQNGLPQLTRGATDAVPERAEQQDLVIAWNYFESNTINLGIFHKRIISFNRNKGEAEAWFGRDYWTTRLRTDKYGADIQGYEFAWQQSMESLLPEPFDGLGVGFNYTYVDSEYKDPDAETRSFLGMSKHSYNAYLYFEKMGWQARIAYNWTEGALNGLKDWAGAGGDYHGNDYGQWDLSAGYKWNDNLEVNLEVVNLTDSRYSTYVGNPNNIDYVEHFGTDVSLGLRLAF